VLANVIGMLNTIDLAQRSLDILSKGTHGSSSDVYRAPSAVAGSLTSSRLVFSNVGFISSGSLNRHPKTQFQGLHKGRLSSGQNVSYCDIMGHMALAARERSPVSTAFLTRRLALFRYQLRQFLRSSERAARQYGITPLQHQLLLGIAGFTGRGWASISELAEFLQERHNAVVTLVQRSEKRGLIRKEHGREDHRVARVSLTTEGSRILRSLTRLHRKELERFEGGYLIVSNLQPIAVEQQGGKSIGKRTQSPEK